MTIILHGFFTIWFISEIFVGKIKRTPDCANSGDIKTRFQNGLLIISCVLGMGFDLLNVYCGYNFFLFPGTALFWAILSLSVFFSGVAIRWISILTLKTLFTVNITIQEGHTLIKSGIYRWIRHPSYLGALLCFLGFALSFSNFVSLILIFVPIAAAYLSRIKYEEGVLTHKFGDEYLEYAKKTKSLIPFLF